MSWLAALADQLGHALVDGQVWLAFGQAVVVFAVVTCFGIGLARLIGLVGAGAPTAETLAVGLASGLVVLAAWWAAIRSGGRSSFTPVAVGYVLAVGLGARDRLPSLAGIRERIRSVRPGRPTAAWLIRRKAALGGAAASVALIGATVLVFASTLTPGARDGLQPIEFTDSAYYSVLAVDLNATGTESTLGPSGFASIEGASPQSWYHWGEIWLASAVIGTFGTAAIAARHFVILPLLLLAAMVLTGSLTRRLNRTGSIGALLLGMATCAFLAPVPFLPGPFQGSWAVGLAFGITHYGLAAVAVLLVILSLVKSDMPRTWGHAIFLGAVTASIIPSHVVVAGLFSIGVAAAVAIHAFRARALGGRLLVIGSATSRIAEWSIALAGISLLWGLVTGHGIPASAPSAGVTAFNPTWSGSLLTVLVGAGVLYLIPAAWFLARRDPSPLADLYGAVAVVVLVAAIIWGSRLSDFNTFHVFFGALSIFAMPAGAVAIWAVWQRLRQKGSRLPALGLMMAVVLQLELGAALTTLRLQQLGPGLYAPVPVAVIDAIRRLPADAKLAYACSPTEEISYWTPRLLAIGVHAGRRIVPLCFEADSFAPLVGAEPSLGISPLFLSAPQRALFPTATASPTSAAVVAFLMANGIGYLYVDPDHPNRLISTASLVARSGDVEVLQIQ